MYSPIGYDDQEGKRRGKERKGRRRGENQINNLTKTYLSFSSLVFQYVDEVVIGAPFSVTKEMIDQLKINLVVHGDDKVPNGPDGEDPYAVLPSTFHSLLLSFYSLFDLFSPPSPCLSLIL